MHRIVTAIGTGPVASALAIAACTAPPLPAAPVRASSVLADHTLAFPGETMQYRVSVGGLTIAHAQVAVGQPGWLHGHHAVIVRAHVATNGIFDFLGTATVDLVSTIDIATGAPLRSKLDVNASSAAGGHEHHHFDHEWTADEQGHDLLSSAGAIRAWHSQLDDRIELEVGIGHKQVEVELWDAGRARIGKFPAVHYDGIVADKLHASVWLSDDASRVPLRFELVTKWGTLTAELSDYQPSSAD